MRLYSCLVSCLLASSAFAQTSFQDIPNLPFLDSQSYLRGITWVDVDNDYDLDVCVTGHDVNFVNQSAIFVNDGNGNFSNTNLLVSAQKIPFQHAWADIDNDDDLDLYIAATWNSNGVNELWKNNGGVSLTLTQNTGATPNVPQPYEGTVSWVDYNNDGWVDLFLPRWNNLKNQLYRNTGNGNFSEVTTGAIVNDLAWTSGGFWGDYDNDKDQDLFVVNFQIGATAPGNNNLFRNNGDGTFTKMLTAGQVVTLQQNGRSANWVDANNDGRLDLFVCNQFGQDLLHINNGNGTFTTQAIGSINHTSWTSNWGDFDNDGDQDLLTSGFFSTDNRFWQNDGLGNLSDVTATYANIFPSTTNGSNSTSVIGVDADLDGWLDLHFTQPENSADHFYKNLGIPCQSWLEVKCVGQQSNHAAIGTTIRAKAIIDGNAVWQMRQISSQTAANGSNPLWQHFGFKDATIIDSLVVEWPSGKVCTFEQVAARQILEIKEDCSFTVIKAAPVMPGSLQELTVCQPALASIQLEAQAPAGGTWLSDCGGCVNTQGLFNPIGLATGDYLVRYRQGGVCDGSTDSFLITIYPQPQIELSGKETVDYGEAAMLMASGGQTYVWEPAGSLSCESCDNPTFTADTTTIFTVIGTDLNGCLDTSTLQVNVRVELKVTMPNAFTPNGDQNNDIFRPAFKGNIFKEYHLLVYSRWGERIFETITPGEGWDGELVTCR